MQFRSIFKRVAPFVVAITIGVLAVSLFVSERSIPRNLGASKARGSGPGPVKSDIRESKTLNEPSGPTCPGTCPVKIHSKPRAMYTDEARQNNIQGNVKLRVAFLSSGQIGEITTLEGLPDGLTEEAIAAAREIRFEPAVKDGVPYSKVMTLQYTFSIY